jgi:hypothetical protein
VTGLHIQAGFVREIRPQMFMTRDRSLISARLMFVSPDRTWPLRERKPLTSAFDHLLVGANGLGQRSRSLLANTGPGSGPLSAIQTGEHSRSFLTNEISRRAAASSGRAGTSQGGCRNFCIWKTIQLPRSPLSPSGIRRTLGGTRATISRTIDSASARLTLPLKWT